jgi:hypothetical protein
MPTDEPRRWSAVAIIDTSRITAKWSGEDADDVRSPADLALQALS